MAQSGAEITRQMFDSTKKIKTLTYKMKKMERIEGEMTTQIASVKLQRNPFKVYTRQEYPNNGLEVLYAEGDKAALINPNGFPWFNLKLDPTGDRMRKKQHHTIHNAGYDHVVSILEHLFKKYEHQINELTTLKTADWQGRECWIVEFNNPHFKYDTYTVRRGESITSIAAKYKLSGYMLLEINEDIDDYDDISEGQNITIPNDYSPRMILFIDQKLMVPVVMKVYDNKGLYEHYEYSEINIDPDIKKEEFTAEYGAYGF
ncbi:hypothetical protein C900_02393 [Fulvivirga imtechensis AK7]|uniref:LysM domain-containing protein n=2 Tax=Fulvivirga TaxID=396811 RepID=L8JWS4_9BACT|nr:hypothetical protein C900_02393 [Fulvivirga imtechensis AK7]